MSDLGAILGRELRRPRVQMPTRYATVISVSPSTGTATVRPSTASATDGSQDIAAKYLSATAPAVGANVRLEVYQGDVLIVGAVGVDDYPAQPYAVAADAKTVTVTAAASATLAVSFLDADRFTVAPIVTLTAVGTSFWVPFASGITATGFTITVRHIDGTVTTASPTVHYVATQMTSTTAAG